MATGDSKDVRRVNYRRLQDARGLILLRFRAGKEQSRVENETVKETGLAVSLLCPLLG